jgi:thioredoxin reductase
MRETGIAVVGAGPAGVAAAAQCARLGVVPLILDRTGRAGGLVEAGFLIENYPGLEAPLPGPELARRFQAHLERFGLSVLAESVTRVEPRGDHWLVTSDAEQRLAGAVILGVGTRPLAWSAPGFAALAGDRVFDDVRDLLCRFPAPRRVLVAGGGEAAFDYALTLARAGAEVGILVRGPAPRATGRLLALANTAPRIRLETGARVASLEAAADGVIATLETPRGIERRAADAVLSAVGRERALDGLLPEPEGARVLCARPEEKSHPPDPLPCEGRGSEAISSPPSSQEGGVGGRGTGPGGSECCALELAPGLFVCGDARLGSLGQSGIAVGDGLAAAALAVARVREVR